VSPLPPKPAAPGQIPQIVINLTCTLEDLIAGTQRTALCPVRRWDAAKKALVEAEESVLVALQQGWKEGTILDFPGRGNDAEGGNGRGDLRITILEAPHALYSREGNNLRHIAAVKLLEALGGFVVKLQSLDGKQLEVPFPGPVAPGAQRLLPKEGFMSQRDKSRGDLIVEVKVRWPQYLSHADMEELKKGPLGKCPYH